MKAVINYLKGHKKSEKLSKETFDSFKECGWEPLLQPGVVPSNWDTRAPWIRESTVLRDGRIHQMLAQGGNEKKIGVTKMSCFANHVIFWKEVIRRNEPMAFIEHDIICIGELDVEFDEYLILNIDDVFAGQPKFSHVPKIANYKTKDEPGIHDLASDWPLLYHKNTLYYGSKMVPGTAAYAVTPKGARKLLEAFKTNGFEQSDFFINDKNVKIQYLKPAICKFNKEYITTSWG